MALGLGFFWEQGPFYSLVVGQDGWLWTLGNGITLLSRSFGVAAGTGVIALFARGLANVTRRS